MAETFDGIILGAGHNALVLQAYASQAGLTTVCLERRGIAGGGLMTENWPPGSRFLHNTHSFYHRGLNKMPWYRDLELERRGAHYIQPALNVAMICPGNRVLAWWTDFEKTAHSFAQFSERDAETLRWWRDAFRPIVQQILAPESQSPPLPPAQRQAILKRTPEGRLLLQVSRLSPLEFVRKHFESPVIQAGLLFFNGLREVDLRCAGFGHHIPALLAADGMAQMCLGGSQRLADALLDAVHEHGGTLRLNTAPRRILVEQGRAVGVETTEGEVIRAREFVASSLNPQQTFLELLAPQDLPAEWQRRARSFRYNLLAPLLGLHVNLREPPQYAAREDYPELADAFMVIMGLEHSRQFDEITEHHEAGTAPPPVMWGSCPSQFDPQQAPPGAHTAFMWQKLPYRLHGNPYRWDTDRQPHVDRMRQLWTRHAPNLANSIIDGFSRSPLDTERELWNMREGDLLVGAFTDGQVGYHRPFPGAGHYRSCLQALYLCGSSCHPGGNVTGLPGYNCAQVLLNDLQRHAAWMPPPVAERL